MHRTPDLRGGATAAIVAVVLSFGCGHRAARQEEESTMRETVTARADVDGTHDGFSLNVYRNVVRGKVLRSFAALSERDPSLALALMSPDVEYTFEGSHALGGTRTSRAGVEKWFARLLRLLPGTFTITSVEVVGWPWRSTVYTVFEDTVAPAYGETYRNHGIQVIDLEWGKAVRIHTYVDTATVERALRILAEHGFTEASAPPILE
jgi:ketosteroid isomerase-like protein